MSRASGKGIVSAESVRLQIVKQILAKTDRLQNEMILAEDMDDAAIVKTPSGDYLVIASDFVRGTGFFLFELGLLNYFDVGYYLIAANVSDIAAMGARPSGLTTVIRYSKSLDDSAFAEVFLGMRDAADEFGATIVGGDIGGYEKDVFSATAFGFIDPSKALLRRNVQDGDILCVTGAIGGAIAAISYFKELKPRGVSLPNEVEEALLRRWKRPEPRIEFGVALAQSGLGHACMDVSDGLKASVEQLARYSGHHFLIYENALPFDKAAAAVAEAAGIDLVKLAVSASVDFELMFTISPKSIEEVKKLALKCDVEVSIIGEINRDCETVLRSESGDIRNMPGVEWEHQTTDYIAEIINTEGSS